MLRLARVLRDGRGIEEMRRFERTMPVEFVPADHALAETAGELKAAHKISLADAFAAALAAQRDAELVTGDPELKALDSTIKLRWLG